MIYICLFFFFQAEDGIRDLVRSRGLGDVYKRQRVDVVSVPDALMSEPSEVIRLVVDALEIGPEVMSLSLIHI